MKKGLLLFILILGTFATYQTNLVAAEEAIIQVDNLNVRTGPGTTYDRIGKVNTNETYTILEEKGDWLKIQRNSTDGWVAKWLTKVKKDRNVVSSSHYSKYDYLRIRSAPGLDGKVRGYLMKDDQVKSQERKGRWLRIEKGKVKGWVHGDYLSKNESQSPILENKEEKKTSAQGKIKVGTSVLNVRSQNSTKGEIINQVRKGQIYDYIAKKGSWYEINLGQGKYGWIAGWLVNEVENNQSSSSTPSDSHNKNKQETYVSLIYNSTNLRNGPSTNHKILGRGHKGDRFDVIDKQGQWYKISYKDKEAYLASWIVKEFNEESSPATSPSNHTLNGKTILIDAGHGGRDPGAVGRSGSYEKSLTLDTAFLLKKELENKGAKVLMTRKDDTYISLSIRSYQSKRSNADAFVSLHYNSAPSNIVANGLNSYYYHSKDKTLATSIHNSMVNHTGLKDRGTKKGNFHVIRENNKPAVLLELGFISDAREEQTLLTSSYQQRVSQGITDGLIDYFN
ncbi:N-acetylmuramoyl-L-alanine amidase [Halobacillus dabanensis]|uniref:N-acetylmuramoyl-L-alanine amidase n=1 Tax=Halobacillus dabanensis TaxID=240302 RepID=A0A1I3P8J8_HALDA|nr:N-acetylmuramoyl-L-alanine amidase [Halobacillus dabanensis]SFJ17657.1 N-acetylmuramoyl-L-alanine amidase [Halobacillus dabanensis]